MKLTPLLPSSAPQALAFRRVAFLVMLVVWPSCKLARDLLLAKFHPSYGPASGGRAINHYARTVAQDLVFISGVRHNPMKPVGDLVARTQEKKTSIESEIDTHMTRPEIEEMWNSTRSRAIYRELRRFIRADLRKLWPKGWAHRQANGAHSKNRREQSVPCDNGHCLRMFADGKEMRRHSLANHVRPIGQRVVGEILCPAPECYKSFQTRGGRTVHIKCSHDLVYLM